MSRYSGCKKHKEESEGPMICDEDSTIQKCDPDHADRDYLYLQRDGLMHHEVPDIWSQLGVVHQPVIQRPGAAEKQCCSKKEQRSGGQYRKKNAENA